MLPQSCGGNMRELKGTPSSSHLRQNFKSEAMLWTDQLEVAPIECENARDVQTFRHCDDHCVYKIDLGIGLLP